MIKNERQYGVTKKQIPLFEQALTDLTTKYGPAPADPLQKAQREAIESQLADLRDELRAYEALLAGVVRSTRRPISELSEAVIEARIASGLTQKELAERLGMQEQQIQRYEATDYSSASLARVQDVIDALEEYTFTFLIDPSKKSPATRGQGSLEIMGSFHAPSQFGPSTEQPIAASTYFSPQQSIAAKSHAQLRAQGLTVLLIGGGPERTIETPMPMSSGSLTEEAGHIRMVGNYVLRTGGDAIRIGGFSQIRTQPVSIKGAKPKVGSGEPAA